MKTSYIFCLLTAVSLTGCASMAKLDTASGMPEVTLPGIAQADALDAVVKQCITRGLNIESQTNSTLVCSREAPIAMQLLAGGAGGSTQQMVQFVAYKEGNGTKLISNRVWEVAPTMFGGARNTTASVPAGTMGRSVQDILEHAKASLGLGSPPAAKGQ